MSKQNEQTTAAEAEEGSPNLPDPLYRSSSLLKFNGELEFEFQAFFASHNLRNIRFLFVGAFILFLGYGLLDWLLLPEPAHAFFVRYAFAAPILLSFLITSFFNIAERQQQTLILLSLSCYCLVILALFFSVPEAMSQAYFSAFLIAMMTGLALSGIQFVYSLLVIVILLAFYVIGAFVFNAPDVFSYVNLIFFVSAGLVCGFGSYFSERSARIGFIQNHVIKQKQQLLAQANEELKRLVDIDGLTGVANRRHFDERLSDEWRRAQRAQYPVALLMIDIDYFKKYNDEYGHQKGDSCLKSVAAALKTYAQRPGDLTARYGGEEFVIILPHLDLDNACVLGKQICTGIANEKIEHSKSSVSSFVTVSVGAASIVPAKDGSSKILLETADQALYKAKSAGRNCCIGLAKEDANLNHSIG